MVDGVRLVIRAVLCVCLGLSGGCKTYSDLKIKKSFTENFDRTEIGDAWNNTGGPYMIQSGQLHVEGAHNKPLWLRRALPRNVRIEFDACSLSKDGDIKVEVFGDGVSKAETDSYTASGYVAIFGGWHNQLNVIARRDEHGADRAVGAAFPVVEGRMYRMKFERQNGLIRFFADDRELVRMQDSSPLYGPGHDHFAFNNWSSHVWFDNVRINPL